MKGDRSRHQMQGLPKEAAIDSSNEYIQCPVTYPPKQGSTRRAVENSFSIEHTTTVSSSTSFQNPSTLSGNTSRFHRSFAYHASTLRQLVRWSQHCWAKGLKLTNNIQQTYGDLIYLLPPGKPRAVSYYTTVLLWVNAVETQRYYKPLRGKVEFGSLWLLNAGLRR